MACIVPGKTKMKQAASPPIREITRPMSGMKRARTRVMINHTSVCRILLLLSRRTHTSTCSPWKRSQSPSITALEQHMSTAEYWEENIHKNQIRTLVHTNTPRTYHQSPFICLFFKPSYTDFKNYTRGTTWNKSHISAPFLFLNIGKFNNPSITNKHYLMRTDT